MAGRIMDGKKVGAEIRAEVTEGVDTLKRAGLRVPGLAAVLVGENPASKIYVASKVKACGEAGIYSEKVQMGKDSTTEEILGVVTGLNRRDEIDGILVQLPLPDGVNEGSVLEAIDPSKDVDGFHPISVGRMVLNRPAFVPCTPAGIMELLRRYDVELKGKRVVIVGRSNIVGKPLFFLLLREHATVTVCHSRTQDLPAVCREADILVAAVGRPGMIDENYIKPGAVVVDVGINRLTEEADVRRFFGADEKRLEVFARRGSTLVGDVHPLAVRKLASLYTPVPGGVGPLTIAMLLSNTLTSARSALGAG